MLTDLERLLQRITPVLQPEADSQGQPNKPVTLVSKLQSFVSPPFNPLWCEHIVNVYVLYMYSLEGNMLNASHGALPA